MIRPLWHAPLRERDVSLQYVGSECTRRADCALLSFSLVLRSEWMSAQDVENEQSIAHVYSTAYRTIPIPLRSPSKSLHPVDVSCHYMILLFRVYGSLTNWNQIATINLEYVCLFTPHGSRVQLASEQVISVISLFDRLDGDRDNTLLSASTWVHQTYSLLYQLAIVSGS